MIFYFVQRRMAEARGSNPLLAADLLLRVVEYYKEHGTPEQQRVTTEEKLPIILSILYDNQNNARKLLTKWKEVTSTCATDRAAWNAAISYLCKARSKDLQL